MNDKERQEFLENNYPKYYSCPIITEIDALQKLIDNEMTIEEFEEDFQYNPLVRYSNLSETGKKKALEITRRKMEDSIIDQIKLEQI